MRASFWPVHLGRPKGERKPEELSLEPVASVLAELLEAARCGSPTTASATAPRKVVGDLRDGQVALLENLRFHPGEEDERRGLREGAAKLAEVYVNDAFGAAHRAHASVSRCPRLMRERGAGLLMQRELAALEQGA